MLRPAPRWGISEEVQGRENKVKGVARTLPIKPCRKLYSASKRSFPFHHAKQSTLVAAALTACWLIIASTQTSRNTAPLPSLTGLSRLYLRLAVALGERDPDSLDYYFGPSALVADIRSNPPTLAQIRLSSLQLIKELDSLHPDSENRERREFLLQQSRAIASRAGLLLGAHPSFDQETEEFFGMRVPPQTDQGHLVAVRSELNGLLPGRGGLAQRYLAYDTGFVVPRERLRTVMARALEGCRTQTLAHIPLPADERVTVEYVSNKPWSAFSRYQGGFHSTIQINTDFPLTVDRVLQLACHEAYPGHHTYNSIRDMELVQKKHWSEFTVQPTFSPQSLASEAAATFAVEVAFPGPERTAFERSHLFPLAGLDPKKADRYCRIERLVDQLHTAEPSIARAYLDGQLEFVRAGWALESQALMADSDATLKYINEYRSYMATYTYGRDMVAELVDKDLDPEGSDDIRWRRYFDVMRSIAPLPRVQRDILQADSSSSPIGGRMVAMRPNPNPKRL